MQKFPNPKYPIAKISLLGRGFTLLELLVVIAIIGVLSTIAITTFPATQRRARDAKRKAEIKQYQTAMEIYSNKNNGNYPPYSGPIANPTYCSNAAVLNLPSCPEDPDAPTAQYQIIANNSDYVIWATLEDPETPTTCFVVCSTGEVGDTTTCPSSVNCPL